MPDRIATAQLVEAATTAVRAAEPLLTGARSIRTKAGPNDVVTEHDLASEAAIAAVLQERTPDARILGEEGSSYDGGGPVTWHVDPIDGTSNYASGAPLYCISVGAAVDDQPVAGVILDPCRNELFTTSGGGIEIVGASTIRRDAGEPVPAVAEQDSVLLTNFPYEGVWYDEAHVDSYKEILRRYRGVRRLGSSALALAWVAAGRASAACELRTSPWDHAAGMALVKASGGTILGLDAQGNETSSISQITSFAVAAPGVELHGSTLERLLYAHIHTTRHRN